MKNLIFTLTILIAVPFVPAQSYELGDHLAGAAS